jgi:hypothetical protein
MYRVHRLDSPGSERAVRLRGEYAYVANGISLQIAHVLNVAEPVWVGGIAAHDYVAGVAIQGDLAYVIDGGELRIFDLTDPVTPSEVGSVFVPQDPDYTETVSVSGDLAFVCGYGLDVVDVSIPTAPVVRGGLTNQYTHEAVATGSTLYVAHDTRGLSSSMSPIPTTSWRSGAAPRSSAPDSDLTVTSATQPGARPARGRSIWIR